MAQQIKKVGVLGAGLMGHGITQVTAQSGYEVVVRRGCARAYTARSTTASSATATW